MGSNKSLILCTALILPSLVISCDLGENTAMNEPMASVRPVPAQGQLHRAVHDGDFPGVKRAVMDGADVNELAPDTWQQTMHCIGTPSFTPIQVAVWEGHTAIADFLISCGADIDANASEMGTSLLAMPLRNGRFEMTALLLRAGADGNAPIMPVTGSRTLDTPLTYAYREGKKSFFYFLLEQGLDINDPNSVGDTVLAMAAQNGNLDEMDTLIELGADVNAYRVNAPIEIAARQGNALVVQFLIDRGAEINGPPTRGQALVEAVNGGHMDIVELLLQNGADVACRNITDESVVERVAQSGAAKEMLLFFLSLADDNIQFKGGDTKLRMAIRHGFADLVREIVSRNPGCVETTLAAESLMLYAYTRGETAIAELLIELGAPVNLFAEDGQPYLANLPWHEERQLFTILVEHGADVSLRNRYGRSLLFDALRGDYLEPDSLFRFLLLHGADPNLANEDGGTPLEPAIRDKNPEAVRLLIAHGADVTLPVRQGIQPVYLAAGTDNLEVFKALEDAGADTSHVDGYGRSVLIVSTSGGGTEILKYLSENGFKTEERIADAANALRAAAANGNVEGVKILLEAGVDINSRLHHGRTPLTFAFNTGIYSTHDIVPFLLEHGARVTARDDFGRTPILHAASNAPPKLLAMLLGAGADQQDVDSARMTTLMCAAKAGNAINVQYFLHLGVPIDALDSEGQSALHWVALGFNERILGLLENSGGPGEYKIKDLPRYRADYAEKFSETARLLLKQGVDPTLKNAEGKTALDLARDAGITELAEVLAYQETASQKERN